MMEAVKMIEQALEILTKQPIPGTPKIGIGITTRNRYDIFKKTIVEIERHSPGCKIVVVDDASSMSVPEATYRFDVNVGIARAKNKCLELLDDCEHIFLFDDDTYPLKRDWYLPYINSGHAHLMYIFKDFSTGRQLNDTVLLYEDSTVKAWSHARGCMLYFKKECLEKVGGMNPVFGSWGWEHVNLSERIYYAGLTRFKYGDIPDSSGLFYSADEHETVVSTVTGHERTNQINRNRPIYESLQGKGDYVAYHEKQNILLTAYFTGVKDPQRGNKWEADFDDLQPLFKSLNGQRLVVLHDCFDGLTMIPNVEFVKVETSINPYFQRWVSYRDYLRINQHRINEVFCIDATDVELLRSPFGSSEISKKIHTGDEVELLGCEWIKNHHKHPKLLQWVNENANLQLLNAGILGGPAETVISFAQHLLDAYFTIQNEAGLNSSVPDAGKTDMALFNYVARTYFAGNLSHGQHVNTRFKANERTPLAWFKHK